jgi:hypothetical protein
MNPISLNKPYVSKSGETIKLLHDQQNNVKRLVKICLDQTQMFMNLSPESRHPLINPIQICFIELNSALQMHVSAMSEYSRHIEDPKSKLELEENMPLLVLSVKASLSVFESLLNK